MESPCSRKVQLVVYAIFGLLPGSLLEGAAGRKFAGMLFTLPLEAGIITRTIVLAFMLLGVVVSGIAVVTATSTTGWLPGRMVAGFAVSAPATMREN